MSYVEAVQQGLANMHKPRKSRRLGLAVIVVVCVPFWVGVAWLVAA